MPSSPNYKLVEKFCACCGVKVKLNCERDIERKNFCSRKCANTVSGKSRKFKTYSCENCGCEFDCQVVTAKRCKTCREDMNLQLGRSYKMLHNNPEKYLQHALYKNGRENIPLEYCLDLLKTQNGKCAISDVEMTFTKIVGRGNI